MMSTHKFTPFCLAFLVYSSVLFLYATEFNSLSVYLFQLFLFSAWSQIQADLRLRCEVRSFSEENHKSFEAAIRGTRHDISMIVAEKVTEEITEGINTGH